VRVLSALSGAALSGLLVLYARRFVPLWAATLAGLGAVFGHQFVIHGRELRAYEFLALITLIFAYVLTWAKDGPSIQRLAVVSATVAIGALTHYFFLFSVAAALVWTFTSTPARIRTKLCLAILIGLLPLAVWAPVALEQHQRGAYKYMIGDFSRRTVVDGYWTMFSTRWPPYLGHTHNLASAFLVILILAGAVILWRKGEDGRLVSTMALVPFLAAAIAWRAGQPIFDSRNLLAVGPFAAICIVTALARLPRHLGVVIAATAAVILVFSFLSVDHQRRSPAFDEIARALLQAGWTPADPILIPHGANWVVPLSWYLPAYPRGNEPDAARRECDAVFTVTWARRFPEERLVGEHHLPGVQPRTAGPYLVLRIPSGVKLIGIPPKERIVNRVCTVMLPARF